MIRYLSGTDSRLLRGTALLRLDFNTEDDWRMQVVLPTVKFLLKRASKILILSHKGRPVGRELRWSLRKDAAKLSKYLKRRVVFIGHFRFGEIEEAVDSSPPGSILVLENLRFLPGEEKNDRSLAKKLAAFGDYYVNDAFAVCHRANASVAAITKFLPSYAGLELEEEIKFLSHAMERHRHPFVIILGGGKAHDKLGVLKYFKNKANSFLLAGAPANTILYLKGVNIKKSLRDEDKRDLGQLKAVAGYKNLILPTDFKWGGSKILDIGHKTIENFVSKVSSAKTVVWSGPLGFFEKKGYGEGTLAVARAVANNRKAFTLAGGGETVEFLRKYRLDKKFTFVSTGGGAMLDFLAGKRLPGIEALK